MNERGGILFGVCFVRGIVGCCLLSLTRQKRLGLIPLTRVHRHCLAPQVSSNKVKSGKFLSP